jgi:hypothetical protein
MRFFLVVPPLPRLMFHSFAVVTALSAVALALDSRRAHAAAVPILTLQVFAVSTGFAAHARRGHYDLLLAGGIGRVRTALVQWMTAAIPGVTCWAILAALEAGLTGRSATAATGTLAALFLVSTLPWALTIALPRFSAAIGWMLAVVVIRSLALPDDTGLAVWSSPPDAGWQAAISFLIVPVIAAGSDVSDTPFLVAPGLVAGCVSMALALGWIARMPIALETGQ